MDAHLPFLISTNSFGIICLLIFAMSAVVFTIPVFSTRGSTQAIWAGVIGFLLTAEAVGLIVLVVLVNNGTIFQKPFVW